MFLSVNIVLVWFFTLSVKFEGCPCLLFVQDIVGIWGKELGLAGDSSSIEFIVEERCVIVNDEALELGRELNGWE
jgi:hypothetical protein